jgi:hypothetical protein
MPDTSIRRGAIVNDLVRETKLRSVFAKRVLDSAPFFADKRPVTL